MTTHPTDTPLGTPRCDAQLVEPYTDGSMRSIKPPLTVGDAAYVPAGFAYTLETELNEVTKALDFNTRTLADACKEVVRLTALLRQKDEALRAIYDPATRGWGLSPENAAIVERALALTPQSPTP